MSTLIEIITRAYQAREVLHEDTEGDTYRLFHGYSEGIHGLEIDRYGSVVLIQSKGADISLFEEVAAILCSLGDFSCIVGRARGQLPRALYGELPIGPHRVKEGGLYYNVDLSLTTHPGLYLDARLGRDWIRKNSESRRVLNLFSFAGSLGVAAMAGQALSVTHVDTQKRALQRCIANHHSNGQSIDPRDLEKMDVQKYLRKTAKGRRRFGAVIVDPPPSRAGSHSFSPAQLAPWVSRVIAPGAWLMYFFHHCDQSWQALEEEIIQRSDLALTAQWRGKSGIDFPETHQTRALRLSVFRVAQ